MLLDFWENSQEYSEEELIQYLKAKPFEGIENNNAIKFFVNYGYRVYFSTT